MVAFSESKRRESADRWGREMRKILLFVSVAVFLGFTANVSASPGLDVNASAAMEGAYGLEVSTANQEASFVVDETPDGERVYRVKFLFDTNAITMIRGTSILIFEARSPVPDFPGLDLSAFRVVLRAKGSGYYVRVKAYYNPVGTTNGKKLGSPLVFIGPLGSSGIHEIEAEWEAGDAVDPIGYARIRLDGGAWSEVGVKNKVMSIDMCRLGAILIDDAATVGSMYFDSFESYRTLSAP